MAGPAANPEPIIAAVEGAFVAAFSEKRKSTFEGR
jgi:hypothetical protein